MVFAPQGVGAVAMIKAVLPTMRKRRAGHIVNVRYTALLLQCAFSALLRAIILITIDWGIRHCAEKHSYMRSFTSYAERRCTRIADKLLLLREGPPKVISDVH
jgi:hypothetical protein